MSPSIESPVLLTVRGTLVPKDLETARQLHNETAGSAPGIAAARALGDLSHKAYAPCLRSKLSSARDGELLFLDHWVDPKGIMEFFANKHVQEQGGRLFSERDGSVWMAARGAFAWNLPAAMSKPERYVGMIRGPVKSPEQAIDIFRAVDVKAQRDGRRRGQLSHQLFVKLAAPNDTGPIEILGLDTWCDLDGMTEHYTDATHMPGLKDAFAGPTQNSVWEQAPGTWSEW